MSYLLNSDSNSPGIFRCIIIYKKGDILSRIYIPGRRVNPINDDGSLNEEIFEKNKSIYPEAMWCSPPMRDAIPEDKVLPGWMIYESGDEKRPIIVGYLGKGLEMADEWSGSSSGSGGTSGSTGGSGNISVSGSGKKVLIVPGHSTKDLHPYNTPGIQTNYGTFIYTQDARDRDGECSFTRKTAKAMYDYIEQQSPGLSQLYDNYNNYEQSLFNDIFNKTIEKGFFSKYQAIVEIHFNSGGNGLFYKDDQQTDSSVISIGKELIDALENVGYPRSGNGVLSTSTINGGNHFAVTQRCSILDGNQAFYYMETKNMDNGVTDADCKKIGEALGKVICAHYKVTSGGGLSAVANNARSLLDKDVKYSMPNRKPSNYNTDSPSSLDCSSFVYWCYLRAGLLPDEWPYSTETFWTSNYFEHMAGSSKTDCESFINSGKLQEGDVLLRSASSNFGGGSVSHALIVAPGTYNGNSFKFVNCGGSYSSAFGKGAVKGTNDFFYDSENKYYGILRYKSKS